jgi:nucleoside-diphosphate-sugar epimerase
MRAIITGSKGFIGKAFAEATTDIFQEQILVEKDILEGDWRKLLRLHFLDKPDAVFHFGACSDTIFFQIIWQTYVNTLRYRLFIVRQLLCMEKSNFLP